MGKLTPGRVVPSAAPSLRRAAEAFITAVQGVALLAFFALVLTGCVHTTYSVPAEVLIAAVGLLKGSRKLQFGPTYNDALGSGDTVKPDDQLLEDRHKSCFVYRRAVSIGGRHQDWSSPQNLPQLTNLIPPIDAQMTAVENFLSTLVNGTSGTLRGSSETTNPLGEQNGQSSATPAQAFTTSTHFHLDLANAAIQFVGTQPADSVTPADLLQGFVQSRINAVRAIAWRAASLHDELWSDQGDGAVLNTKALMEIIDRRLRSIERMNVQVNGAPKYTKGKLVTSPQPGRGPWPDQVRVRMYEYPGSFSAALTDPQDSTVIWNLSTDKLSVTYSLRQQDGTTIPTRFLGEPQSLSTDWPISVDQNNPKYLYTRVPKVGANPSALLDTLMVSDTDVWKRTWLFCDHSVATLHLDALRFALLRQPQKNPIQFDGVVNSTDPRRPSKPFVLGALMNNGLTFDSHGSPSVPDIGTLFQNGSGAAPTPPDDRYFENTYLNVNDLQVGDHVILWNHHLYAFLTRGAWRLENAYITELDVNPLKGEVDQSTMRLTGFGASHRLPAFRDDLIGRIQRDIDQLYKDVNGAAQAGLTAFINRRNDPLALVFQWEFFTGLTAPGLTDKPWFMFLPKTVPGYKSSPWPDLPSMTKSIHYTFVPGLAGASTNPAGYNGLPTSITADNVDPRSGTDTPIAVPLVDGSGNLTGVLYPLFLPVLDTMVDWPTFFARRSSDPLLTGSLVKTPLKGEQVPGLNFRGAQFPIQVVRPRVRP